MDWNHKHILISNCYGLGDVITCTPALRRFKEKYPFCHITLLTSYNHVAAIKGLPYIDEILGLQRGRLFSKFRLLHKICQQDGVAFTDWQPQLLLLSYLMRVPVRGGIERKRSILRHCLINPVDDRQRTFLEYAGERRAKEIGGALSVTLDGDMTQCDVAEPTATVKATVDELLSSLGLAPAAPFLLLSPFAGDAVRYWPVDEAKRFTKCIQDRFHLPVIVTGSTDNIPDAEKISPYTLAGKTNIPQLIELIRRASLLVTPDSGPMHIAGAVGTKVVALFSKDLPSRWAPHRNCKVVMLNKSCSPCYGETAGNCQNVACMRDITADMVLAKCFEIGMDKT
jgi:ADP-heptose:LPS heptosyltransferase